MARQRLRNRLSSQSPEVNVLPVMNLFLVLIPFLLLTAVFARTAIFELSLPTESETSITSPPIESVATALALTNEGIGIVVDGRLETKIPLVNETYDYGSLTVALVELKKQYPQIHQMVLIAEDDVIYEQIVEVMGRCTQSGFSEISFSGGVQ